MTFPFWQCYCPQMPMPFSCSSSLFWHPFNSFSFHLILSFRSHNSSCPTVQQHKQTQFYSKLSIHTDLCHPICRWDEPVRTAAKVNINNRTRPFIHSFLHRIEQIPFSQNPFILIFPPKIFCQGENAQNSKGNCRIIWWDLEENLNHFKCQF